VKKIKKFNVNYFSFFKNSFARFSNIGNRFPIKVKSVISYNEFQKEVIIKLTAKKIRAYYALMYPSSIFGKIQVLSILVYLIK